MKIIKITLFFLSLYKYLKLFIPNHVKFIAWKSKFFSREEIKPTAINLSPEVIHFYNGKSALRFESSV